MQLSTLNAYPSAVPVPKEIFADVLHALPFAASITILVGKYVLLGFFKFLQHTVRIVLKCPSGCGPNGASYVTRLGRIGKSELL
jgi:hypothetical protein